METEKVETKKTEARKEYPNRRVLLYGKTWADQFYRYQNNASRFVMFHLTEPRFLLPRDLFDRIYTNPAKPADPTPGDVLYNILALQNPQASALVQKIHFYTMHSHVVLVDTEFLDTAIGQEILSTAYHNNIPAYGVGVRAASSPISPFFTKSVLYPKDVMELITHVKLAHQMHWTSENDLEES